MEMEVSTRDFIAHGGGAGVGEDSGNSGLGAVGLQGTELGWVVAVLVWAKLLAARSVVAIQRVTVEARRDCSVKGSKRISSGVVCRKTRAVARMRSAMAASGFCGPVGLIAVGGAEAIGDADDWIAAEGSFGGGEGACDVGVGEGRALVDLGAIPSVQAEAFGEGVFCSDADDGSGANGSGLGLVWIWNEVEQTGTGLDGGGEAAAMWALRNVGSGELIDLCVDEA